MLYSLSAGVNAAPHSQDSDYGDDYAPAPGGISLSGLAAVVPHKANVVVSSGGGYVPQGSGGLPAGGETSVAVTGGGVFYPVGRTTSPFTASGKPGGVARNRFQPSSQGARISRGGGPLTHISRGSGHAFPAGGLYGLSGHDGMGDFFGDVGNWFKNRVTPPGGNFARITPIPANIRNVIPSAIKTPIRYAGAIATAPLWVPFATGSQQRRLFGLNAKESRIFMKGAQFARIAAATVLTAGAAKWAWGLRAATVTPGSAYLPGSVGLKGGAVGAKFAGTSQVATAAQFGGPALPAAVAAPASAGLTPAAVTFATPAQIAGASVANAVPASVSLTTPAVSYGAASVGAAPAVGGGFLTAVGAGLKTTAATISTALLPIMVLKAVGGQGGGMMIPGSEGGGTSVMVGSGERPAESAGGYYSGGGGGAPSGSSEPILAGPSLPMILVVGGLAATIGYKLLKGKRK